MPTVTVAQVVSDGVAGATRSCVGSGMLVGAEEGRQCLPSQLRRSSAMV